MRLAQAREDFDRVDVLFGRGRARTRARRLQAAIAASDAGATRAEIAAAHDVLVGVQAATLRVQPGEFSVLVGPSGSGKSTLLRTANALTPITRGHVWVQSPDGQVDVAAWRPETIKFSEEPRTTVGTLHSRQDRRPAARSRQGLEGPVLAGPVQPALRQALHPAGAA